MVNTVILLTFKNISVQVSRMHKQAPQILQDYPLLQRNTGKAGLRELLNTYKLFG